MYHSNSPDWYVGKEFKFSNIGKITYGNILSYKTKEYIGEKRKKITEIKYLISLKDKRQIEVTSAFFKLPTVSLKVHGQWVKIKK